MRHTNILPRKFIHALLGFCLLTLSAPTQVDVQSSVGSGQYSVTSEQVAKSQSPISNLHSPISNSPLSTTSRTVTYTYDEA